MLSELTKERIIFNSFLKNFFQIKNKIVKSKLIKLKLKVSLIFHFIK